MKDGSGVLCFSLGSRLRGNDGGTGGNDGGLAGMTEGAAPEGWGLAGRTGFTLTLGPPLNLPLGRGGRWLEGEGI